MHIALLGAAATAALAAVVVAVLMARPGRHDDSSVRPAPDSEILTRIRV
ncbi:hypothetical protein [Streptomyces sp. NRRL S-1022]|nr:hypothetical protein [Streptomyces sp. NRRL S-1022]